MRLWSLHPKYLDQKGLVACWREALLAKKVLRGKTEGYRNHPQLNRFREFEAPLKAINTYLHYLYLEACSRDYCFDGRKARNYYLRKTIPVTKGQLVFEFEHLGKKLRERDKEKFKEIGKKMIEANPVFKVVPGRKEGWERS